MDTPVTTNYMIAGYAVFSIILLAYLVSLYSRWKRLVRDLDSLEELAQKK